MTRWVLVVAVVAACRGSPKPRPAPIEQHDADTRDDEESPATEVGHEGDDDTLPPAPPTPAPHDLDDEAMRIVNASRASAYVHRTTVDEAAGRFEVDCSGFLGYALSRVNPRALAEVRGSLPRRPLAKDFVAHLRALPPEGRGAWLPIANPRELAPGDVIAWLKPADVVTKNTGHVMIVRDAPRAEPERPDVLVVPIIDSAAVTHGKGDSRKATRATGVGTGEILLLLDTRNQPVAYRWSRGSKAKPHTTTIVLGRLR